MLGQAQGKDGSRTTLRRRTAALGRTALLGSVCALALAPSSQANPSGGVVVAGDAAISGQGASATVIDQASQRAIIDWNAFSVAADGSVVFNQPNAEAIALNRVVGQNPSTILGAVSANGRIVLINPNGVLFGEGATVDVNSLVATTHDISNAAFMAGGELVFDQSSGARGYVVNEGLITVDQAGLAAFVAPHVRNSGVISAKLGTVELGAASMFTVDFYGDDLISFPVDAQVLGVATGPDGRPVEALAVNDGRILAEGGSILMTASAARGVIDDVILAGGEMVATSFASQGGTIVLSGGDAGDVQVAGLLDASGATGGSVSVEGERVFADGDVRANGAAGAAGSVSVAGDWVSVGGSLSADGATGGSVDIAARNLSLAGDVSATGSAGAGGAVSIAVEGRSLEFQTASIDASGVSGGTIRNVAGRQITSSASYDASGTTGDGGLIDISASAVKLLSTSIDASGANGGRVRLGGEFQGGAGLAADELPNATVLASSTGTRIDVSATADGGAGGTAIVWSESDTLFQGAIDARPGGGGQGGFIEVSSKGVLNFNADLQTGGGEVLLDPKNLTIVPDTYSQLALILGYNYAGAPGGLSTGGAAIQSGDNFGAAISLDGDRLAVGAPGVDAGASGAGAVYLFTFSDAAFSNPVLEAVIGDGFTGGKNVSVDLELNDGFGSAVSLDETRLAVGAPRYGDSDAGGVMLFHFDDLAFTDGGLSAILALNPTGGDPSRNLNVPLSAGAEFGAAVSLENQRLAVGAPGDDGALGLSPDSGAIYLFNFSSSLFYDGSLSSRIGVDYSGGNNRNAALFGVSAGENFGSSVALQGLQVAVGARRDSGADGLQTDAGAVYLLGFDSFSFSGVGLRGTLGMGYVGGNNINVAALGLTAGDNFGQSIAFEGSRLLVGAPLGSSSAGAASESGDVYQFDFNSGAWTGGTLSGRMGFGYAGVGDVAVSSLGAQDHFGSAVSLSGDRLAIGAFNDDGFGDSRGSSGAVYLINRTPGGTITPALATFANNPGANSFLTASALLSLLNAGNSVTLQANNDITVSVNLIANGGGSGGALTLEAGRSILINGSIVTDNGALTLLANQTAAAGVVDAHRDAGAAVITMANGTTIDTGTGAFTARILAGADKTNFATGALTLRGVTAGSIAAEHFGVGDVVLNGALSASGAGNSLVVRATGGGFINTFGAGALNPGAGRFVVFSQDPAFNTLNGITGTPYYNTPGDSLNFAALPSGDVLAYELAPTLTITATSTSRTYGAANPSFAYTISGYINDDELLGGALSGSPLLTTLADQLSGVGGYGIDIALGSLVSNYNYGLNLVGGALTIDPAALVITTDDATRTYGAANPAFTASYSGFQNGDDQGVLSGLVFSTPATVTSNVGTYAITASGASAANYTISYQNTGLLTVDPAALLITANNATRTYGAANPAFSASYSGFLNGDDESVLSGLLLSTPATAASNVGTYAINASGAAALNYAISYGAPGVLTIDPAALLVTTNNASRTYGAANPAFTASYSGFVNGDDESALSGLVFSTPASVSSPIGTYAINASGASALNYTIGYQNTGLLTIDPAALLVTANNASRTYGAANPAFSASYSGFLNGDDESVLSGLVFSTPATVASNVGTYDITASGASAANYTISYGAPGVLTIDPAALLITTNNASRIYGAANPAFTASYSGFLNGDDESVLSGLAFSTPATVGSNVGTYAINASGASALNYDVSYHNAGVLTINPAALLITANNASRTYGAANPAFSATYSGFVAGDDESVLSGLAFSTPATAASNVGTYAITASGATAQNYDVSYGPNGVLTVNPAPLTITANNASRSYGDANPALSASYAGFVNGDTAAVVSGLSLSTTATLASNVGGYAINASGAAAQNYAISYGAPGVLTVNPAALLIATNNASRLYGDANPTFSATFSGLKLSDTSSVVSGLTLTTPATQGSNVGTYAINAAGGVAQNYAISYQNSGLLSVTPAPLTLTVNDATAVQGDPLPGFSASYSGLKLNDTASVVSGVSFSTSATQGSLPGSYVITSSGGVATNYVIVQRNDGTLSIVPASGQIDLVQQLQSDVGSGQTTPALGGPAGGNAADFVFATSTGAAGTESADEPSGDADALELICVLADERECPTFDGAAE